MNTLMTVDEVAAKLRVKKSWIYAHYNQLGAYRLGKYLRFSWSRVLQSLDQINKSSDPKCSDPEQNTVYRSETPPENNVVTVPHPRTDGKSDCMTRNSFQKGYVSEPIRTVRGTVYKIRYRVPVAPGKWKHRAETLSGLAGKKEAREVPAKRLQNASNTNNDIVRLPLSSFIDEYWKPYLRRKNLKPSTMNGYQSVLDHHVLPSFGNMRMDRIAPIDVERFLQEKAKKGYSGRTMRNLIVLLHGIFQYAEDNDLINRSPIRAHHKPVCQKAEKSVWTSDQVRKILETVPAQHRCLFTCVALTALRLGELLALQWKSVDMHSKRLRVAHSLWNRQLVLPKTAASKRSIPLGNYLVDILAEHRRTSAFCNEGDFVFCRLDGKSLNPDVLRKDVLYCTLDRLNIPRSKGAAGFHAFRHSAASLINAETGNLKLTQKFLGHANFNTTADIYTHISKTMEREAADALEKAIFTDSTKIS